MNLNRVISLLLSKGYMELEETLMQWKQKTHLLRILEPMELELDKNSKVLTDQEKLILNIDND
jgi:NADH dehydrogenase (ubiquinone) 1 alpha subcomplex subunit 6